MSQLANRLVELRAGQSQAEFARQLGIQRPQLANYEKGINVPSAEFVFKICNQTGASADWLLGLDKRSDRQNVSVQTGAGGVSIGCGSGNVVRGTIVAGGDYGNAVACAKCPFKKKLKALEKLIQK